MTGYTNWLPTWMHIWHSHMKYIARTTCKTADNVLHAIQRETPLKNRTPRKSNSKIQLDFVFRPTHTWNDWQEFSLGRSILFFWPTRKTLTYYVTAKVSFHSAFFLDNNMVMIIRLLYESLDQVGDSYCAIAGGDGRRSLTTQSGHAIECGPTVYSIYNYL